ncbi:MAG TPA: acetamidase/formamidase family protein [Candidatus Limnocylindrales bacterium]|nr:acetamidase/formamidase family protein [Candidatus Limnocylindrales bacterium]
MSENAIQSGVKPDATLKSLPDTVLWGYIAANLPPALTIKSGQIVEIEALSHQGLTTNKDPERFFAGYGIPGADVLADAKIIYSEVKRPKGASVHILTGPIYVEGAEPGDTLEIRVHDIKFRVPYGVNNTGPGKGVLPKLLTEATAKLIRIDLERRVALFSDDIHIPLNPFMGIMAVSPPTSLGMVSSTPPGAWGGNIDLKFTGIGSSLFLPVFNKGGQFFTGDGHAVQGDGEVDGGAIEISLKPTLQFILHKGKVTKQPRVETATDYLTTGLDVDLNVAARIALQQAVEFLEQEKGLSAADAYALSSLAVDLGIGEAVDIVNLVYAKIPKNIFKNNPAFWHNPA